MNDQHPLVHVDHPHLDELSRGVRSQKQDPVVRMHVVGPLHLENDGRVLIEHLLDLLLGDSVSSTG